MDEPENSLFLLRMLAGPATAFLGLFVTITMSAPLVLYLVARWRAQREAVVDPQLGVKFALHYFLMIAFQLVLASVMLILFLALSKMDNDEKGPVLRGAFGLLVPAGIVLGVHLALLRKTNDLVFTGVRRLFLGYNLLTTGLVGFVGLVMAFEALFAKGSAGDLGRAAAALVTVYCGAWGGLAWMFGKLSMEGPGAGAMPYVGPTGPGAPQPPSVPPPMATPLNRD